MPRNTIYYLYNVATWESFFFLKSYKKVKKKIIEKSFFYPHQNKLNQLKMAPPQQYEPTTLDPVPTEEQIDIKQLAAKGYYFEFPEKTVCIACI